MALRYTGLIQPEIFWSGSGKGLLLCAKLLSKFLYNDRGYV